MVKARVEEDVRSFCEAVDLGRRMPYNDWESVGMIWIKAG